MLHVVIVFQMQYLCSQILSYDGKTTLKGYDRIVRFVPKRESNMVVRIILKSNNANKRGEARSSRNKRDVRTISDNKSAN